MTADVVIFDCDGVLIDSELLAVRADIACLAEAGIEISVAGILERYLGISAAAMLSDIERRYGRRLPADFSQRHHAALMRLFHRELMAVAHVEAALDALAAKVCVASGSASERLRHGLSLVGLYKRLSPHVFSANMVRHGKPAPDLFLYAAREMGVLPERCVVVEDSLAGIAAARAAGMTAIGFCGGSHCAPDHAARLSAAGATSVIADLRDLAGVLARL